MTHLLNPLTFSHGPTMKNRFMLAPLTMAAPHIKNFDRALGQSDLIEAIEAVEALA
jgi:hypothetical protein